MSWFPPSAPATEVERRAPGSSGGPAGHTRSRPLACKASERVNGQAGRQGPAWLEPQAQRQSHPTVRLLWAPRAQRSAQGPPGGYDVHFIPKLNLQLREGSHPGRSQGSGCGVTLSQLLCRKAWKLPVVQGQSIREHMLLVPSTASSVHSMSVGQEARQTSGRRTGGVSADSATDEPLKAEGVSFLSPKVPRFGAGALSAFDRTQ